MTAPTDLRALGDRVAGLVDELGAVGDPTLHALGAELVRSLMRFYGGGLERLLEIVDDERAVDAASAATVERLFTRFAEDGVVATLLLLHGLHPLDAATRVQRALDGVRPFLASHGGDVTLLAVEGGIVRLRLEGSCHGCPSSAVTMKLAVEEAIAAAAPEVVSIEVDGVAAEPDRVAPGECLAGDARPAGEPAESLVQIGGRA